MSDEQQTHLIASSDIGNLFDARGRLKRLDRLPAEVVCMVASVRRQRCPDGTEAIRVRMRDRSAATRRLLDDYAAWLGLGDRIPGHGV